MEKIPSDKFAFFVYRPKKKKLTTQQKKVQQLSEISKVCLRKDESKDTQSLFKCVAKEAKIHIIAH